MANLNSLLILNCLLWLSLQISIPLVANAYRCMIVYTSTADENLILDMKFPPIPNQVSGQSYRISLTNTQQKVTTEQRVNAGTYRKQLDLQESVVYKVCFSVLTNRNLGTLIIEYNAETKFNQQIETVKIPETLLKSNDFKNTYAFAQNMHALTEQSIQFQKNRREKQDAIYIQNRSNIDTLFWISLFEILVILLTGVYQFFSVRSFLISKQYL